ncbi:MAG: hypothetical protein RMM51_11845 [Verrucomicrobiae bacterium]|nr:hypothetical protein [Verrucomicrobiae bacterium]
MISHWLALILASSVVAPPQSPRELQERFEQALRARDLRQLVALYHWEGVSRDMRNQTAMMLDELARKSIRSVQTGRLSQRQESVIDGVRYRPNLSPAGAIVVTYAENGVTERVELPYGRAGQNFWLCGVVEERIAPPKPRPRRFGLSVGGTAAPQPAEFTGFYVIVKDGQTIRKEFQGAVGLTRQVLADELRYCEVRKTTPHGAIYLLITADGQTLFESPLTEQTTPITYGSR